MDRVRRRIQSSGTVVELFQGYVADLHASYFPPPHPSHLFAFKRDRFRFYWTIPSIVLR